MLEGSLLRGEERLAKLAAESSSRAQEQTQMSPVSSPCAQAEKAAALPSASIPSSHPRQDTQIHPSSTFYPLPSNLDLDLGLTPPPRTKPDGLAQWEAFLRDRFIRGGDDDFDYSVVDEDEEYDVLEREQREEAWFDEESPGWAGEDDDGGGGDSDDDEGGKGAERELKGETGVQDF